MKKKSFYYHWFLFLSTFTRGLVELFSLVLLYQKGFLVEELFFFLFLLYTFGIFVNYVSLKISYKFILIISSFLYGCSFLYLSWMKNTSVSLFILAILLSSSNYSYHVIRHYFACSLLDKKNMRTNIIVTVTYLGVILASIIGIFLIDRLPFVVTAVFVLIGSFLSFLPIFKIKINEINKKSVNIFAVKVKKKNIYFHIFEQFKVMFLEIQPLFLYLYVEQSVAYVGIFNIIVNLASLILVYFLSKKINKSYFKYFCVVLGGIFVLKLNVKSGIFLFGLAFLEGIFVKIYENVSLGILYDVGSNDLRSYLLVKEFIFFGTKSLFMLFVVLFKFHIYLVLYLCIIGIIVSGFFIGNDKKDELT